MAAAEREPSRNRRVCASDQFITDEHMDNILPDVIVREGRRANKREGERERLIGEEIEREIYRVREIERDREGKRERNLESERETEIEGLRERFCAQS